MQHRRPASGLTPLSIVLPKPSLPRRRSSLLSLVPSPRTPRSTGSPTCSSLIFSGASNRKSIDSWNSSNQDLTDLDYDWKPEQVLFLRRTLDALPPHLVTPFNGPIPPSNLLDKIARGVAQAKGEDWPHSLRATRVKLIELSRAIAEEDSKPRKTIPEESGGDISAYPSFKEGEVLQQTTNIGRAGLGVGTIGLGSRRPLYRQSSMDFLNTSDIQEDDSISRLSKRLQKADRVIPNAAGYHPYSRSQIQRRSSSPPRPTHVPSLINPSTPSTSTLSSLASLSAAVSHPRTLRRSVSITSSSSTTSSSKMSLSSAGALSPIVATDPRVQRVRRSESFCAPIQESISARRAVKRAPSYGALAQQESRDENRVVELDISIPDPSSDEEEKIRTRRAKKPRVRTASNSNDAPPLTPSPGPSPPSTAVASPKRTRTKAKSASSGQEPTKRTTATKKSNAVQAPEQLHSASAAANPPRRIKRTPSMFGAELPCVPPQELITPPPTPFLSMAPLLAPAPPPVKTLRRVRRLPPARRISFESLVPPVGEERDGHEADMEMEDCDEERERGLGSAFQLR